MIQHIAAIINRTQTPAPTNDTWRYTTLLYEKVKDEGGDRCNTCGHGHNTHGDRAIAPCAIEKCRCNGWQDAA